MFAIPVLAGIGGAAAVKLLQRGQNAPSNMVSLRAEEEKLRRLVKQLERDAKHDSAENAKLKIHAEQLKVAGVTQSSHVSFYKFQTRMP